MRLVAAVCALPACGASFNRRPYDLGRYLTAFCSRACRDVAQRRGVSYTTVTCSHCGVAFAKRPCDIRRGARHFCSHEHYLAQVDRRELGRRGGLAEKNVSAEVKFRRSSAGGLARARNLSKEQIRAIALQGVAARTRRSAIEGGVSLRAGRDVLFGVRLGRRR